MTAFKAKRTSEAAPGASPNSSVSGGASGQPRGSISGPITKVMHVGVVTARGPEIRVSEFLEVLWRNGFKES